MPVVEVSDFRQFMLGSRLDSNSLWNYLFLSALSLHMQSKFSITRSCERDFLVGLTRLDEVNQSPSTVFSY